MIYAVSSTKELMDTFTKLSFSFSFSNYERRDHCMLRYLLVHVLPTNIFLT